MNARLEEMIDRGSIHFKHCSRSNINLSAGKRDWGTLNHNLTVRFCEGSRPGGLLFSHLPLNDLDAILTARTTRRTLSIPHIWSLLANPVGRRGTAWNKWGGLKGGKWHDALIHYHILDGWWRRIQLGQMYHNRGAQRCLFPAVVPLMMGAMTCCVTTKKDFTHPNSSPPPRPVAKEPLRAPEGWRINDANGLRTAMWCRGTHMQNVQPLIRHVKAE